MQKKPSDIRTLAATLYAAKEPLSYGELDVASGRRANRNNFAALLKRWERAGLVETCTLVKVPITDIPGRWPKEKAFKCYRMTQLGRRLYRHILKMQRAGKATKVLL